MRTSSVSKLQLARTSISRPPPITDCRAAGPITLSLLPAVALTPCCSCTEPRFIDSRALAAAAVVAVDAPAVALLLE
eukprot:18135-Heterococcus_DN1.PRE.2